MALNLLVVDDSLVMRKMVIKTLKVAGVDIGEIYEGANGAEGIAQLEEHWIDMVFVDINMPVMNGEEMIQRLRANPAWKDMPIVVVSTEGSKTRIDRIKEQGAKFVHKPFSPEVVRGIIADSTGAMAELSEPDQEEVCRSHDMVETLSQVAEETFESLAFILALPEDMGELPTGTPVVSTVLFTGPCTGALSVAAPKEMLAELAENMLGEMDEPTEEQQSDAMRELVNVVCGNLLPRVRGNEAVFNVQRPSKPKEGQVATSLGGCSPVAVVEMQLEWGKTQLALFLSDEHAA